MDNKKSTVTIILCTHKFVDHAEEQLKSIKNQINVNIKIVISIDSEDESTFYNWKNLAKKYFKKDALLIVNGPKNGFSINFLNTLINLEHKTDYYAFSDHDDLWDEDKIYCAIKEIRKYSDTNIPILYGSRSRYIDENGNFISLSKNYSKNTVFKNAIVQCFAGGNTMVFNNELFDVIKEIGLVNVKSHDWWIYILSTANNGKAIFDSSAHISYRQHNYNISGGNKGFNQAFLRFKAAIRGDYRIWNKNNVQYLYENIDILSHNNKKVIEYFIKIQNGNFFQRIFYLFKSGIYRQQFLQNIALFLFAAFKKI